MKLNFLVTGSQNAQEADRFINRKEIIPVQFYNNSEIIPLNYFNDIGKLGVSSFALDPNNYENIFMSDGDNLFEINLRKRILNNCNLSGLKDIHEMDFIQNLLFFSNTGYNEIIGYDKNSSAITYRMNLANFNHEKDIIVLDKYDDYVKDKFHVNQIFLGYDNQKYCLVHHVEGVQFLKKVKNRLLKIHGDGGVINLESGKRTDLELAGPHSLRKIKGNYWVCSSKEKLIKIYGQNWKLLNQIETKGWGRGAAVTKDEKYLLVGNSAKRRRYYIENKESENDKNFVQVFDIKEQKCVETITIMNIEQINNIYVVDNPDQSNLFLKFI